MESVAQWLGWLAEHAEEIARVAEALVVIVASLAALWRWLREQRAQGIRELVPAVVALVQDAKAQSWASDAKPMADVAGLVARNLRALAASRGLGELSPTEVEHGVALASATHKALKLEAAGYTGQPAEIEALPDPAAAKPAGGQGN